MVLRVVVKRTAAWTKGNRSTNEHNIKIIILRTVCTGTHMCTFNIPSSALSTFGQTVDYLRFEIRKLLLGFINNTNKHEPSNRPLKGDVIYRVKTEASIRLAQRGRKSRERNKSNCNTVSWHFTGKRPAFYDGSSLQKLENEKSASFWMAFRSLSTT